MISLPICFTAYIFLEEEKRNNKLNNYIFLKTFHEIIVPTELQIPHYHNFNSTKSL